MTVEIRIGESAGEGEGSALDIDLVVQMGGTLLKEKLVPQISEHAELRRRHFKKLVVFQKNSGK